MQRLKLVIQENKNSYPELVAHPEFDKRLRWELIEIEVQDEEEYFLEMFQKKEKKANPHNLLVPVLLGVCDTVDLSKEPLFKMGDFPDVDVDYLPVVRDYLKNEWAPKQFGSENVCSIGNYGTFGLKSSLIDMTRVHGLDRNEILKITTAMGLKDDDGQALTLDKALEMYPELKTYCDKYPEVEKAVRKLLHRNRSMGKHAGGLIICNNRVDNFVPLVRGTDGAPVSSWVEGLHGQDLGPVGLIKFDLLVVDGVYQIALATRYVKSRHNIENLCALSGDWDWSDTAYLNDPASMEMANQGDLKCIFQYDSEGIRTLAMKGGVDSFDDLVAYVSLYRPSCLQMKMDEEYVERKRGRKSFEIPEVLKDAIGQTYGVLIYQEQIMQILNIVGKIPLRDCYQVIKAISKKKVEGFKKYKEKFVESGQQVLGKTAKEMEDYFALIESFAGYGFNLSHATAYSYISARQLYLKSHYPLEFFTASLQCQDNEDKRRDYITEALNHGVVVKGIDLNKSKETFDIVDDTIYIGFSNIKGIGEDKAKKIASLQPYSGFEDFLERYGTEAGTIKPLIGLGVFGDNKSDLYLYWLKFCEYKKQFKDKEKRFEATKQQIFETLLDSLPEPYRTRTSSFGIVNAKLFELLVEHLSKRNETKDALLAVKTLQKKFLAAESRFAVNSQKHEKPVFGKISVADCKDFDDKYVDSLQDKKQCEINYYGFLWTNEVRQHAKHKAGFSFDKARTKAIMRPQPYYMLQGIILDFQIKKFKSNNGQYVSVELIDEDMHTNRVTVWWDDYLIFKQEIAKGNFISLQVAVSTTGFQGFTLYGPPRHKRHLLPAKNLDTRLVVL